MAGTKENGVLNCVCELGYKPDGVIDTVTEWPKCVPLGKCTGEGEILKRAQGSVHAGRGVVFEVASERSKQASTSAASATSAARARCSS